MSSRNQYDTTEPHLVDGYLHRPTSPQRRKKRIPVQTLLLLLAGLAMSVVLYVGNIIAVDLLLTEINQLETKLNRIRVDQEILQAQINRMSGLDRIQEKGEKELGLKNLGEPPIWISVDQEKIAQIKKMRESE